MDTQNDIPKSLSNLVPELLSEILQFSKIVEIADRTEILREGQYVKVIPIVMEGLIKVYTRNLEKELLLYYIKPEESCIMSFSSGLKNEPSRIFAITEGKTKVLLLPVDKVMSWSGKYAEFNALFFQQYNLRYSDLLETINHVLFHKLDKRLLDYLIEKSKLLGQNPVKISHTQIAGELGTAREVISRLVKKLEHEGMLKQLSNSIKIIHL